MIGLKNMGIKGIDPFQMDEKVFGSMKRRSNGKRKNLS